MFPWNENALSISVPSWEESITTSGFPSFWASNAENCCFLYCNRNKLLNKQFELPVIEQLWYSCNITVIVYHIVTNLLDRRQLPWWHYYDNPLCYTGAICPNHKNLSAGLAGQSLPLINTLRPRQNGRRFTDDTFKRIFWNENVRISIKISLKFVP